MKTLLLSLLIAASSNALAEESHEILFGDAINHGGFGGPQAKITRINGETNYIMGGRGAWLVNNQFYLGGGGFGLVKRMEKNGQLYNFGYGGVIVGYIGAPHKLFHYGADLLLGGGGISKHYRDGNMSSDNGDAVLVAEPSVYMTLNLTHFAELNVGAGYRFVNEADDTVFSASDLNGWVVNFNVMFGKF